jgi:hypothetical protein
LKANTNNETLIPRCNLTRRHLDMRDAGQIKEILINSNGLFDKASFIDPFKKNSKDITQVTINEKKELKEGFKPLTNPNLKNRESIFKK